MKISVKNFAVTMELGNKGITLDVYDTDGTFLGDIRFGRATIEWCKGKKHHGVRKSWKQLIEWFES